MVKLFCFSIAGGSAQLFQCIEPYLPQAIQVIKLEYAGHGSRMREPFYADMDALVEDMYSMIQYNLEETDEYMLFGYSMGSMVLSATLASIICKGELHLPKQVFLAAHIPGISGRTLTDDELENDETVKKMIVHFGGVPEDIISSAIFWKLYMPIHKSDYRLMRSFDFDELKLRTSTPITVFYCEEDTAFEYLQKWNRFYTGGARYYSFSGGHFFIKENAKRIATIIEETLTVVTGYDAD